jgi:hypothetical protein
MQVEKQKWTAPLLEELFFSSTKGGLPTTTPEDSPFGNDS